MSTRSVIAKEQKDGTIKAVYCHFDGYPQGVGANLLNHYSADHRAENLISEGSISILAPLMDLNEYKEQFVSWRDKTEYKHDFDNKISGISVFYSRDRGEEKCIYEFPQLDESYKTEQEMKEVFSWCQWIYLFKEGKWFFSEFDDSEKLNFEELTLKDIE